MARAAQLLQAHPELRRPVALDVAEARLAYLKAEFATMAEAMGRALAAGPVHPDPDSSATVAYLEALLLAATGRPAEAQRWLRSPCAGRPAAGAARGPP